MLPVFLSCSRAEMARRVGNPDRVARRKVASEQGLTDFLAGLDITAVPRDNCLRLDTEALSAEASAQAIAGHLGLVPSKRS